MLHSKIHKVIKSSNTQIAIGKQSEAWIWLLLLSNTGLLFLAEALVKLVDKVQTSKQKWNK